MSKTSLASRITRGLLICFLLIQEGEGEGTGRPEQKSTVKDRNRTVVCVSCEPHTDHYPPCPDKLNPDAKIEEALEVDHCFQCFIGQTWVAGVYKGERRGCLTGNINPPGSCTYYYPIDGEYGYGQENEIHEVCRCGESHCNNVTDITILGGIGDASKFPKAPTPRGKSGARGMEELAPIWVILLVVIELSSL